MLDNFVWGTKVVTTFLYDDFGAVTNETVLGVAGTNTIERYYDAFRLPIGNQQDALTSKKEMPSLMNFFQGSAIATFLSK